MTTSLYNNVPPQNFVSSPETSMYLNSVSSSATPTSPSTWNPLQLPVTYSTPNASETYLVNPRTVPIPSVGPQPTLHLRPNSLGFNSRVQVKKMALPTFSGNRKDWPEFKAIWKSVAETACQNKTALAHELKRSVKGTPRKNVCACVNLTCNSIANLMRICSERFRRLKMAVKRSDFIVRLYSQISSAKINMSF